MVRLVRLVRLVRFFMLPMLNGSALFGRLLPYYLIDKKYAFGHSVPIEPIIYASVMLGAKLFIYTH